MTYPRLTFRREPEPGVGALTRWGVYDGTEYLGSVQHMMGGYWSVSGLPYATRYEAAYSLYATGTVA
jgi:hypothetical protein